MEMYTVGRGLGSLCFVGVSGGTVRREDVWLTCVCDWMCVCLMCVQRADQGTDDGERIDRRLVHGRRVHAGDYITRFAIYCRKLPFECRGRDKGSVRTLVVVWSVLDP